MTDWRELERARVADLEARGEPVYRVSWTCHHAAHEPPRPVSRRTPGQKRFVHLLFGSRYGALAG